MGEFESLTRSVKQDMSELAPQNVGDRLRHEVNDMMSSATKDFRDLLTQTRQLPKEFAQDLFVSATTLPTTRLNDEESKTKLFLDGSLKERKLGLTGEGPLGTFALRVQSGPAPMFRNMGYELNASSDNQQSHLRLWSDKASHAPYMDISTRLGDGLVGSTIAVNYLRDVQQNKIAATANFPNTSLSVGHDFRRGYFDLAGHRAVGDYFKLGVNMSIGRTGYYDIGAEMKIGK